MTDFLVNTMGVEVIVTTGSQDSLYATNPVTISTLYFSVSHSTVLKTIDTVYSDDRPGLFWRTTGPDTLQSKRLENICEKQTLTTLPFCTKPDL